MTSLALGTVQFGLAYGVANAGGKAASNEVARILQRARQGGIDVLDTAAGYGDSETVLGAQGIADWNVVTKLSEVPEGCVNVAAWIDEQVGASLDRLEIAHLYGLLLHRPHQLQGKMGPAIWEALQSEKARGRVAHVGYSIYGPDELDVLYPLYKAEIVQAPFNVMDRRLIRSGWLQRLTKDGVAVHTRSAFLQGLLLMSPEARPAWTDAHSLALEAFDTWAIESAGSRQAASLAYCLSIPEISHVVIGVQDLAQLEAALMVTATSLSSPPEWPGMEEPDLIDPRRWPKAS